MKIYSMTATFGKLEHETLTLQPGLNIIEAPNEWGKSTWCAFLVAMLYGIETRVHSTKAALADKERYAPWSGAPMSGRMDICWEGRDITIERRTKGRSVFGDFKAYETQTGVTVPELTATNCGQVLLGVEKAVFTRTGFIRLTDLPVTQDESLRRRLNALVTTGDESGAGDQLAQKLRDLKNKVRFNRSGLLPQAEAQRAELAHKLRELESLRSRTLQLKEQQIASEKRMQELENHRCALLYAQSLADRKQVETATNQKEDAAAALEFAEAACRDLPEQAQLQENILAAQGIRDSITQVSQDRAALVPPQAPITRVPFQGLSGQDATAMANADANQYHALCQKKPFVLFGILCALCLICAVALFFLADSVFAAPFVGLSLLFLALGFAKNKKILQKIELFVEKYGSENPDLWKKLASDHVAALENYASATALYQASAQQIQSRLEQLQTQRELLTAGISLQDYIALQQKGLSQYAALSDAQKEYQRAVSLLSIARAMAKEAPAPLQEDFLTCSKEETERLLNDYQYQQRQLSIQLGQCMGQMDQLGQEESLKTQLEAVENRIHKLEDTYQALSIAQQTLASATSELQRRFAPQIAHRAQDIFCRLTGARYNRLSLSEDMSLSAGAADEDTLRSSLWRSDGTVDQLYLALRLAVAGALTPQAPLVLDDALVRFDDKRLAFAMDVLREEADQKQVLLFTCQGREHQI